jgi:hypothetical protein
VGSQILPPHHAGCQVKRLWEVPQALERMIISKITNRGLLCPTPMRTIHLNFQLTNFQFKAVSKIYQKRKQIFGYKSGDKMGLIYEKTIDNKFSRYYPFNS